MSQTKTHRIHEGEYMVEMQVTLTELDHAWGPLLAADDVKRLDLVRDALRRRDLDTASKFGRVFKLSPLDQPHKRAS